MQVWASRLIFLLGLVLRKAIDLAWKPQSVFGAGGFFANSLHAVGYAGVDALIPAELDIDSFAKDLSQRSGKFVSSGQIFVVSIVSILSSPSLWGYIYGLIEYIASSKMEVHMPAIRLNNTLISWNVAAYYNDNSVSLNPVLLARLNQNLLVGTGLELGVLGQPELDLFLYLRTGIVENLVLSTQFAVSLISAGRWLTRLGLFVYPAISYQIGRILARNGQLEVKLNAGMMLSAGQTLLAQRLNPYNSIAYSLSISMTL